MKIYEIFEEFDSVERKGFDELDISGLLKKSKSSIEEKEIFEFEILAMDFVESPPRGNTSINSFFGHKVSGTNKDGSPFSYPNPKMITQETIEYWKNRADNSSNPILKARYSGLIWSFENEVCGNRPSHKYCQMYVDALLKIAKEDYGKYPVITYGKLEIALTLSSRLNDQERINSCKDVLISYEDRHAVDDKAGLWGHSFELLIDNKKVNLNNEEEDNIIDRLKNILFRLSNDESNDIWSIENVCKLLLKYYNKRGKQEEIKQIFSVLELSFNKSIETASVMQAVAQLNVLYDLSKIYNQKELGNKLLLQIQKLNPQKKDELQAYSIEVEISYSEIKRMMAKIISSTKNDALKYILYTFRPNKKEMQEKALENAKQESFLSEIPLGLLDDGGRTVAQVGTIEDDLEGNIVLTTSNEMILDSVVLGIIINESIKDKDINADDVMIYLDKSAIIDDNRKIIIKKGLDFYFLNDYISSVHLLIPQFENAMRNFLLLLGGSTYKESKNGGFNHKTFDEILRDELIINKIGEDWVNYFKVLFTDARGWNLRNNICHGLSKSEDFDKKTADRVFHAILFLGLLIKKP